MSMIIFIPLGTVVNIKIPLKMIIFLFAIFTGFAGILALSGYKPKKE